MSAFKEVVYKPLDKKERQYVLAGDIGGTNSNFGLCSIDNHVIELFVSIHTKSKEVQLFTDLVQEVLNFFKVNYHVTFLKACFGAAGVVTEDRTFCKPTNLTITLDAHDIKKHTYLKDITIINDFEAVGYGVDRIAKKDLVVIQKGHARARANRAIIGAGTGLGKGILGWDYEQSDYVPIPSEGGHADFALYTQEELALCEFIKQEVNGGFPVSWENVLSGDGIVRLYTFLGTQKPYVDTESTLEIKQNGHHPDIIFKNRTRDVRCTDTFARYSGFYARCAKNFVLESLALGGLYIAGGIAANNIDLFYLPIFLQEFTWCRKQQTILKDIPIHVIADYNVSLFGAAAFLIYRRK